MKVWAGAVRTFFLESRRICQPTLLLAIILLFALSGSTPLEAERKHKAEISPSVLPPDNFVGKVALGYSAAKAIPDICSKLFCYCGCDLTDSHTSLLDCFTCEHGVDCTICQDEAIIALDLKKKGKSLSEIQKAIDDAFQKQYPFEEPSPALKKYRALIEARPGGSQETNNGSNNSPRVGLPSKVGATAKRRSGGCCGHNRS